MRVPTVTIGHSTAFTWDGEMIVYGHEPGGGTQAECEAADDPLKKTFFFYRASDGALLGTWLLPRPQGPNENCTLHNFHVVPFLDRHVMVHGSYQAGTGDHRHHEPGRSAGDRLDRSAAGAHASARHPGVLLHDLDAPGLRARRCLGDLLVQRPALGVEHLGGAERLAGQRAVVGERASARAT